MTTYIFSHYLMSWIAPPGIQILFILFAIAIYRIWPFLTKSLIVVSVITLWLASAPIVSYRLIETLQNRYPPLSSSLISSSPFSHGAIVVLGGGDDTRVEDDNKKVVSLTTFNRLHYAVYLFKKTHLPLIVSGGREMGSLDSEADLMLKTLRETFSISTAIKEDQSLNTAEESRFVSSLLKQYQFDGIYLVTNAWHMPRSVASFKRAGIRVIPAPMGYQVYDHHYTLLSYFPNIQALEATNITLHEWIGLLWYKLHNK